MLEVAVVLLGTLGGHRFEVYWLGHLTTIYTLLVQGGWFRVAWFISLWKT